jgi:hypothetical protein
VPVAVDDNIQVRKVDPPGVLANDVDPDNPADPGNPEAEYKDPSNVELEASKVSGLENGSVVVKENGKVVIDSISEDRTFTYRAKDMNNGKSDTATVRIDATVE